MKLLNKVKKLFIKLIEMVRQKRDWHPEFRKYMKFIVKHPNYKGMPEPTKDDGTIKWVISGNSELGKRRARWWDDKVKEMGLNSRADVARSIHPKELNGLKPCQICGEKLNINYIYPNKNTLKRVETVTKFKFESYKEDIIKIFDVLEEKYKESVFDIFKQIFDIPENVKNSKIEFVSYILENCKTKLSPGVMSNPPDRFDGFHTYNACHRGIEDTGRHKSNLARYSQDRRAYENWAEGNWNFSNRLMGEFQRFTEEVICPRCSQKRRMTADHIGPISLGFTHRPKFNPLCKSCNSGKNNRITLEDVKILITDEKSGDKVISWHSKYIWNKLKNRINSDNDALNLSKAMRFNLHNVLSLLSIIKERGHIDFLKQRLKPEYSFFDYKFENFHPLRLNELKIIKTPLDSKNKQKNAERYVRISLDSLDDYKQKDNRRVKDSEVKEIKNEIIVLLELLKQNNKEEAYQKLLKVIELLSDEATSKFF